MMTRLICIFLAYIFCFSYTVEANTPKEIYRSYNDSVVLISNEEIKGNKKIITYGTAFAIDDRGTLLTSAHLIEDGAIAKNTRGEEIAIVAIPWIDRDLDLAIIKVNELIRPIPLADSRDTVIGEAITIISNPSGFQNSLTLGILSGRRPQGNSILLQHSAPISPGSSGGPIFNEKGEVIGIVQGIYAAKNSQNLNFAVPSEYIPAQYLARNKEATQNSIYSQPIQYNSSKFNAYNMPNYGEFALFPPEENSYSEILSSLSMLIHQQPNDFEAYIIRSLIKHKMNDRKGAIEDLNAAKWFLNKESQGDRNHLQAWETF